MDEETMGMRIRRQREVKGLTQLELADLCEVTKAAVSAWENGYANNIRLPALLALLRVLGVELDYLVDGAERTRTGSAAVAARQARRRRRRSVS